MFKTFRKNKAGFKNRALVGATGVSAGMLGVASNAHAANATGFNNGSAISGDAFDNFAATVLEWGQGSLGIGLAVTALFVGGGIGLIRSTPLPAVTGLALAAFFAWGPSIIVSLVTGGAMVG